MIDLALKLWRMARPHLVVIGDLIRDVEVDGQWGSPAAEAPDVRVFRETATRVRHGGAGAVRLMAEALGADVILLAGENRCVKTRHWVDGRLVWRHDAEEPWSLAPTPEATTLVRAAVEAADAVLLVDYGKGGCTTEILRTAITTAGRLAIPCLVDPAKRASWTAYAGATCLKCNLAEAERALGSEESCRAAAEIHHLIVTHGSKGLTHTAGRSDAAVYAARRRQAIDVTGAGDMVLAALGVAVASGMTWTEACTIAVAASGLKVERRGAVPISRAEVVVDLLAGEEIVPIELLPAIRAAHRSDDRPIVFTNGCFDLLHAGHVASIEEAAAQGGLLVVGLNSDASVRRLKGDSRPLQPWRDRAEVLAGLACVDYVVELDSDPRLAIDALQPDVLVKGADWRGKHVIGADTVEARGGRVHYAPLRPGCSTSGLVARGAGGSPACCKSGGCRK